MKIKKKKNQGAWMLKIDKYMFYMRRRQNYPQKNDFKVKNVPSPIKGLLLLPSPNCKAGCRMARKSDKI